MYNTGMNIELTPEQSELLKQRSGTLVHFHDPTTNRIYIVMDHELAQRAIKALEEDETWKKLQESIRQANAGATVSLSEADSMVRERASFPEKQ